MSTSVYDVVFIGGGMASSMCALYLKREHPELQIAIVEKREDTHWNPGESTVGVAGLFFIRDLGLSTYCYLEHLPKNGLRYFFDDPSQPYDTTECSEIGSNILPIFPTFQLDRKKLDRDLWDFNRQAGNELLLGAGVTGIDFGSFENGDEHKITFERGGKTETLSTKWFVNAVGRNSVMTPIFDELAPQIPDPDLNTAGAWGRFSGLKDIDALGDDDWRRRVGYTSRYLSTNHMMGRGYWIWYIPIGDDVVSVGVVYDKDVLGRDLQAKEDFRAFLDEHRLSRELLEGATQLDFQRHPQLTYCRERFCSKDRWSMMGDAAGFVDPFYSPGADVLSRQCYMIEHLVTAQGPEQIAETVDLVNQYAAYSYNLVRLLYVDQYWGFGSYEVFNIKSLWDFHSYTNRQVWHFLDRKYRSAEFLRRELESADDTIALTGAIERGFSALAKHRIEQGRELQHNSGRYSLRQNRFRIEEEMMVGYDDDRSIAEHLYLCRLTISELVEARFEIGGFLVNKLAQDHLTFASMQEFELTPEWLAEFCGALSAKLSMIVAGRTGQQLEVAITPACFAASTPKTGVAPAFEAASLLNELWQQKASNPVVDNLYAC